MTACSLWCDAVAYGVGIDDNSALVGVYLTLFIVSLPVVSLTKSKGAKGSSHPKCVRNGV